jgi:2-hydroxy-3-oxopropionate reductase
MKSTIGFVGLGVMGRPMAAHAAEHYDLRAYDVNPERASGIDGVTPVNTLSEIAANPTVLLSLPTTEAVEAVVLSEDGLAAQLQPGSTLIDLSTTQPLVSHRIAETLSARDVAFLDAPVSGGEKGAMEATLSIMVGGDAGTFARHEELLSTMGGSVVHVGAVGSGGIAKLVNNMIVGAAFTSIVEGFALAARNDIDIETLYRSIRGGWAGSKVLDVTAADVISGDFSPGGTVNLLWKDLGYARELAREQDVPVPVTAAVDQIFVAARAAGLGEMSQPALVKLWKEFAHGHDERGTA